MDYDFRETILNQIKAYLDGKITKEEYYAISEPYYTAHADDYENAPFHECYLSTVADACLLHIEEPGSTPERKEAMFRAEMSEAYKKLQEL